MEPGVDRLRVDRAGARHVVRRRPAHRPLRHRAAPRSARSARGIARALHRRLPLAALGPRLRQPERRASAPRSAGASPASPPSTATSRSPAARPGAPSPRSPCRSWPATGTSPPAGATSRSSGAGSSASPGGRFGSRVLEAEWDLAYYERSEVFGGHGMLGLDVPRIGRLRGDVTVLPQGDRALRRHRRRRGQRRSPPGLRRQRLRQRRHARRRRVLRRRGLPQLPRAGAAPARQGGAHPHRRHARRARQHAAPAPALAPRRRPRDRGRGARSSRRSRRAPSPTRRRWPTPSACSAPARRR